jgi:dTDP-4-amino-4,6-dideoxygalactose transaminase
MAPMRDTFLPFSPPLLGPEELDEVLDTLRSDWITTGPKVKRFEQSFAELVGAPDALAVSSCTDALQWRSPPAASAPATRCSPPR